MEYSSSTEEFSPIIKPLSPPPTELEPSIGVIQEPLPSTSGAVKEEPALDIPYEGALGLSEDESRYTKSSNAYSSSPVIVFECHHCGYNTDDKKDLRLHIATKHAEVFYRIAQISSLHPEGLSKHSDQRPYSCLYCEYKSGHSGALKTHIMSKHTGEKPYFCHLCEYKSAHCGNLKIHIMAKHTGEQPYSCSFCEYKSAHSANLKIRIMSEHTGEQPYSCPHCEYKSAHSSSLKRHIMSKHTGEKPYSCPDCKYTSAHLGNMKRHSMSKHTGELPYPYSY